MKFKNFSLSFEGFFNKWLYTYSFPEPPTLKTFPENNITQSVKEKKINPLSQIQLRSANKQKFNNF